MYDASSFKSMVRISGAFIRICEKVSETDEEEEDQSVYIEPERRSGRGWGRDRKSLYNIIYEHASGLTPA